MTRTRTGSSAGRCVLSTSYPRDDYANKSFSRFPPPRKRVYGKSQEFVKYTSRILDSYRVSSERSLFISFRFLFPFVYLCRFWFRAVVTSVTFWTHVYRIVSYKWSEIGWNTHVSCPCRRRQRVERRSWRSTALRHGWQWRRWRRQWTATGLHCQCSSARDASVCLSSPETLEDCDQNHGFGLERVQSK